MASNLLEDEDEEEHFGLMIRFIGCRKSIQDGKACLNRVDAKFQPLCKRYVEKASDAIGVTLRSLLTPLPCYINPNGTAVCDIPSNDHLLGLLDNYRNHSELIDNQCTDELVRLGTPTAIGLTDNEFVLHVSITDKDINMAKSYFQNSVVASPKTQEDTQEVKAEKNVHSVKETNVDEISSDSSSLKSMPSESDLSKTKKGKRNRKSKKVRDRQKKQDGINEDKGRNQGTDSETTKPIQTTDKAEPTEKSRGLKKETAQKTNKGTANKTTKPIQTTGKAEPTEKSQGLKDETAQKTNKVHEEAQKGLTEAYQREYKTVHLPKIKMCMKQEPNRTRRAKATKDKENGKDGHETKAKEKQNDKGDEAAVTSSQNETKSHQASAKDSPNDQKGKDGHETKAKVNQNDKGDEAAVTTSHIETKSHQASTKNKNSSNDQKGQEVQGTKRKQHQSGDNDRGAVTRSQIENNSHAGSSTEQKSTISKKKSKGAEPVNEFDPPVAIPEDLQGQVALLRVFVDNSYGDVKSVTAHLVFDNGWKDIKMMQSKHEQHIWYLPVSIESAFQYKFSLKVKRGVLQTVSSFVMGTDGTVIEPWLRELSASVTSDVFFGEALQRFEMCQANRRACVCFVVLAAKCIRDIPQLEYFSTYLYVYSGLCQDAKLVLNEIFPYIKRVEQNGKIFLLSFSAMLCKGLYMRDLQYIATFRDDTAKEFLEVLKLQYAFDIEVQKQIPYLYKACLQKIKTGSKTKMQFILDCFPSVSAEIITLNLHQFDNVCDVDAVEQAALHLVSFAERIGHNKIMDLLKTVMSSVRSHSVLLQIVERFNDRELESVIKSEIVEFAIGESKTRIQDKLKEAQTKKNKVLVELEEIMKMLDKCIPKYLHEIQGQFEDLLIVITERSSMWNMDEMNCLIRTCSHKAVFIQPQRIMPILNAAFTSRKPEIIFGIFKGYLEKDIESEAIDVVDVGKRVMLDCYEKLYRYNETERIFQSYTLLHELENTRFSRLVPDFVIAVHQCLAEKIFKLMTSRRKLELSEKIPEDKDEIFRRLRQDIILALHKEFDESGKQNLNDWIVKIFGEKKPIVIDRYNAKNMVQVAAGFLMEQIRAKGNQDHDNTSTMSLLQTNHEFIFRVMTCTGYFQQDIKTLSLSKQIRSSATKVAEEALKHQLKLSFFTSMAERHQKWKDSFMTLLGLFKDPIYCKKVSLVLTKMVEAKEKYLSNLAECSKVLPKLKSVLEKGDNDISFLECLQHLKQTKEMLTNHEGCGRDVTFERFVNEFNPPAIKSIISACLKLGELIEFSSFRSFLQIEWQNAPDSVYFYSDLHRNELMVLFEMGHELKTDYDSFNVIQDVLEFFAYSCKQKFLRQVDLCLMTSEDVTISDAQRFVSADAPQESMNMLQTLTQKHITVFKRRAIELFHIRGKLCCIAKVVVDICKIFEIELIAEQDSPQDSKLEELYSENEPEAQAGSEPHCINLALSVRDIGMLGHDPDVSLSYIEQLCTPLAYLLEEFQKQTRAFDAFEQLSQSSVMIHFLQSIAAAGEEADLRNLIDAVEEYTEEYVQESTVSDFIQVNSYLRPLLQVASIHTAGQLLALFWKCQETDKKDMAEKIQNCSENIHNLKSLYMNVSNRGEVTKETINNILNNGAISIRVTVETCELDVTYQRHTALQHVHLSELNDLKSRALLIENTEAEQATSSLTKFVTLVDLINDLVDIAEELCAKGHFEFQMFSYDIADRSSDDKISELQQLTARLQQQFSDWEQSLEVQRRQHFFLNYVFSEQIPILLSFFKNGTNKEEAVKILEYISPGSLNVQHDFSANLSSCTTAEHKLQVLGELLDAVCKVNHQQVSFPDDDSFVQMTHDTEASVVPGKLFIAQVDKDSDQGIPVLLNMYANTTRCYPAANQVLFCTRGTIAEEITMLFNRCMKCPAKLFCLFGVEQLDYVVQNHLVDCLNNTIKQDTDNKYLLSLVCRESTNYPLLLNFAHHVNRIQGLSSTSIRECFKARASKVVAVSSEVPSLGKTEYIYEEASKQQLFLHTIHVSGLLTKESLVKLIPSQSKYDAYHFDIGQVENPDALDAFIFELLILRCVVSGTYIAHMNNQSVFIEIANTLQHSLRNCLYLVSHFDRKHVKWDNYESLKVSEELCSPIQVVCNYLESDQKGTLGSRDLVFVGKPNAAALPPKRCRELLKMTFSNMTDMSYSILNTFLEVLAFQLKKLSSSQFFRIIHLKGQVGEGSVTNIRHKMLTVFIEMSKDFACRSIHTCKSTQTKALLKTDDAFSESLTQRMGGMIQWADSNHFLVLFNSISSHTITPLYRKRSHVNTAILQLIESQLKLPIPDFHKYDHQDLQALLEKLVCLKYDPNTSERVKHDMPNYALTPDNLIKMVLIILRITSRLPVILMGETGCGKTSLVKYLALTCGVKIQIINFHAGVSQDEISKRIMQFHNEAITSKSQIWVFLDEINTCNHLGVINDIICHNRCNNSALSSNLVFIAACNPYRLRSSSQVLTAGLVEKAKTDVFSRLVYRVFPLPETMLDYIWDYGVLNIKDEEVYIAEMLKETFAAYTACTVKTMLVELITTSNEFIRKLEGNHCSVSLRDVNRCRTLINYFDQMLQEKSKYAIPADKGEKTPVDRSDNMPPTISTDMRTQHAMLLSLAHCYAVRIHTTKYRTAYYETIATVLYKKTGYGKHAQEIVRGQQMDILDRMTIPDGIAKNTALRENVFVLFVSIMNKIPVFLVGKPGCSKSLSMQLLKNSLRGQDSSDKYFRTLPQLYVVSYQGSEASTSDGILKVFNKAEKYLQHNAQENVLPVVLLDEIGLAEVSSHNPLKVLHSLLEPSNEEFPNVAVVGISNWALDAAKMNRAIHLSRPDLSVAELLDTAVSISKLDSKMKPETTDSSQHESILEALASAYYDFQADQKQKHFHGLRDFYSLVKYISREVANDKIMLDDERLTSVIYEGLQRNFGGGKELNVIIDTFFEKLQKTPPNTQIKVEELIDANIRDQRSRHLLVITRGDSILDVLTKLLQNNEKSFEVMFGSNFEEDKSEGYQYRILSKIIHCMEYGKVLILKDLEDIYGSLYDMLNQNYMIVGSRKNCRIALGPHSNPMCQVHDQFKCIVLIEADKVDFSDPPFLNRFEKQKMVQSDLLQTAELELKSSLEEWIQSFTDVGDKSMRLENTFMGIGRDTLPSLVYTVTRNVVNTGEVDQDGLLDRCKQVLLTIATPDGIVRLPRSKLGRNDEEESRALTERYLSMPYHKGLSIVLQELDNPGSDILSKRFVFTHSNIYTDVVSLLGSSYTPYSVRLRNIHTEQQLTAELETYYASKTHNILLVQCQPSKDGNKLLQLKILIEQKEREWKSTPYGVNKHVFIILHFDRITHDDDESWKLSYNAEWATCTVDNLEECEVNLEEMIGMSVPDMIQSPFCPLDACIKENLLWAFSRFKYRQLLQQKSLLELLQNVVSCEPLMRCLGSRILQAVYEQQGHEDGLHVDHWQVLLACDSATMLQAKTLFVAWKTYLSETIKRNLVKLVWFIEKNSAWNSVIENESDKNILSIWLDLFENKADKAALEECVLKDNEWTTMNTHRLNLRFPFSKLLYDDIKSDMLSLKDIMASESGLKDVENLDSLDESDITELLSYYEPVVARRCELFVEDASILKTQSDAILSDMLCLFVQDFVEPSAGWVKVCQHLLGEQVSDSQRSFTERVTLLMVAVELIAPQLELLTAFVKTHGCRSLITMQHAAAEYDNDKSQPFIDVFVKTVCDDHIPHHSKQLNLDQFKTGIPLVLAYCARLSCFPTEIHFLKVCADLFRKDEALGKSFLKTISESFEEQCNHEADSPENGNISTSPVPMGFLEDGQTAGSIINDVSMSESSDDAPSMSISDDASNSTSHEEHILEFVDEVANNNTAPGEPEPNDDIAGESQSHDGDLDETDVQSLEVLEDENGAELHDDRIAQHFDAIPESDKNHVFETEHQLLSVTNIEKQSNENLLDTEERDSSLLDSVGVYNAFKTTLHPLLVTNELLYQQLWCLYFSRCFDANPDTPLASSFFEGLGDLPLQGMQFAGPIMKKFVTMNTKAHILDCFKEGFEWKEMNCILDKYCHTEPPRHVLNFLCDTLQMEIKAQADLSETTGPSSAVNDWQSVHHFQRATAVVNEATSSQQRLTHVVCVAYSRNFIDHLSINIGQIKAKFGNYRLNEIEQCFTSRSFTDDLGFASFLQIFFVKCLHTGTLRKLRQQLDDLTDIFPRLKDVKWPVIDPVEYGIGYSETKQSPTSEIQEMIGDLPKFEKVCIPLLTKCQHDDKELVLFVVTIADRLFWVRYVDTISDMERQWAEMLNKNLEGFTDFAKQLIACFSGKEDFRHKSMHISTQTKDVQFYQAHVLYTALMAAIPVQHDKDGHYFVKLFFNTSECLDDKAPCHEFTSKKVLSKPANISSCFCKAKTICFDSPQKCPTCETTFQTSGKIVRKFESRLVDILTVREIVKATECFNAPADILTQLVFQVVLLASASSGVAGTETSDVDLVYEAFCENWASATLSLSLSNRDLCQLLKNVVYQVADPDVHIATVSEMRKNVEVRVIDVLRNRATSKSKFYDNTEWSPDSLNRYLLETDAITLDSSALLHRFVLLPSQQHLKQRIQEHVLLQPSRHAFIYLIYMWQSKLDLIPHIVPLIEFLKILSSSINHKMSREECLDKDMEVLIGRSDHMRSTFDEFLSAWAKIKAQQKEFEQYFETDKPLPNYNWTTKVAKFVCEDQAHVIIRAAQTLMNWQNGFLDAVSVCALEGCHSLQFLVEKDSVRIPVVRQTDVASKYVVEFKWDPGLLIYGQPNASIRFGHDIWYDFDAIELSLANKVVLSKCYIEPCNLTIPTYKNEMFLSSNEILDDVRTCIKQEEIPKEIISQLGDLDRNDPGLMRRLMDVLEIILPLVLKTEGSEARGSICTENIGAFANRWKMTKSDITNAHLIKMLDQSLRLCHLVHLYEVAEDIVSVVIMKSLGEEYTHALSDEDTQTVVKLDKERTIPAESLSLALRRFAMRFLWKSSCLHVPVSVDKPLHEALSSASLWSTTAQQQVPVSGVLSALPPTLLVKHTKSLSKHLAEMAKPETKLKVQLAPIRLVGTATSRQRRRGQMRTE